MRAIRQLLPQSITVQITSLVIASVLLGNMLTLAIVLFFYGTVAKTGPADAAARIATVAQLANGAESAEETAHLLAAAQRAGIQVDYVALRDLVPSDPETIRLPIFEGLMRSRLKGEFGLVLLDALPPDRSEDAVLVKFRQGALVFRPALANVLSPLLIFPATLTLVVVTIFLALLSVYAVRWITSPLSDLTAAAKSFGRSPADSSALSERGAREIKDVARSFNEMRSRIRILLDERTRMLAAISHDLRTPLTRLRLRSERTMQADIREGMLHDIARINHMLNETLAYLRDDVRSEGFVHVDLPSLLQTICVEFTDTGQAVAYEGPHRFAFACRPSALTRAITNIVENGIKHGGDAVIVSLKVVDTRAARIEISDTGPGIELSAREKVFEPFYKADTARTSSGRSGFGLGLSIARDIINDHGGQIDLVERKPHGLTVCINLPATA